jgi:hypothetical protein
MKLARRKLREIDDTAFPSPSKQMNFARTISAEISSDIITLLQHPGDFL